MMPVNSFAYAHVHVQDGTREVAQATRPLPSNENKSVPLVAARARAHQRQVDVSDTGLARRPPVDSDGRCGVGIERKFMPKFVPGPYSSKRTGSL